MTGKRRVYDYVVDWRFSEIVNSYIGREIVPGVVLSIADMSRGLMVSRDTIMKWANRDMGIAPKTVARFLRCDDWRGDFAREIWRVFEDHYALRCLRSELLFKQLTREVLSDVV